MRIQHSSTMQIRATLITVGKLAAWLDELPDGATVTVRDERGDRPGETSVTTLTARWETEAWLDELPVGATVTVRDERGKCHHADGTLGG